MKEKDLQSRIVRYLHSIGAKAYVITYSPFQEEGIPDILSCIPLPGSNIGLFVGIETKYGTKLRPKQVTQKMLIERAQGIVFVTDDFEKFKEDLDGFLYSRTLPTPESDVQKP